MPGICKECAARMDLKRWLDVEACRDDTSCDPCSLEDEDAAVSWCCMHSF
jgi:hypothetical protein